MQGHPDAHFAIRWNKEQSRFEFIVTFNIERLFDEYAARHDITINAIPDDRKFATVGFSYPIPSATSLRTLNFGLSPSLISMFMGAANDLAQADHA